MERYNEVLVRLIRIALGTTDCSTEVTASLGRKLSAKEWEAVYGAAVRHSIIGVLLPAIESIPAEERPPMGIAYQWLSDQTQVRLKNEKIHLRAAELERVFMDVELRTHVLKGITLASFYPDPSIRQCGDIDLWVDGQRSDIIRFLKSRVSLGEILFHHCDTKFFDDVEVEVHYRPSWFYNQVFDHRFCAFINAHRNRVFSGQRDVVFELAYNMVHIFRHIFHEGVGMRHLIDYFYVLMASTPEERTEAITVLRSLGLEKFCGAMMYIETSALGLPDEFSLCDSQSRNAVRYGHKLFDEIMLTGNFGMMDRRNEGRIRKVVRFIMLSPRETLCAIPWKCWHLCWRAVHNLGKF